MARYVCPICGYVHDEATSGERFDSLSDSWTCPVCGAAKNQFEAEEGEEITADVPPSADGQSTPAVGAARFHLPPLLVHRGSAMSSWPSICY